MAPPTATSAPATPALVLCRDADVNRPAFTCSHPVTEIPAGKQEVYDFIITAPHNGTFQTTSLTWEVSSVDYKGTLTRQFTAPSTVTTDDWAQVEPVALVGLADQRDDVDSYVLSMRDVLELLRRDYAACKRRFLRCLSTAKPISDDVRFFPRTEARESA